MTKRALVLVEGQTEERFVKDVLEPSFWPRGLYLSPTILVTKRVKNGPSFKGGITTFAKFRNDALKLLQSAGGALVTTLIDYYGLPDDFPGMDTRPCASPMDRATHVERAIHSSFGAPPNFVPFLTLHEFEAWLFSSIDELPRVMTQPEKQKEFAAIRREVGTPEEIDDRPEHAPSKRIERLFPGYRKPLHGPLTAGRIGLDRIRAQCPHFAAWVARLEEFARS